MAVSGTGPGFGDRAGAEPRRADRRRARRGAGGYRRRSGARDSAAAGALARRQSPEHQRDRAHLFGGHPGRGGAHARAHPRGLSPPAHGRLHRLRRALALLRDGEIPRRGETRSLRRRAAEVASRESGRLDRPADLEPNPTSGKRPEAARASSRRRRGHPATRSAHRAPPGRSDDLRGRARRARAALYRSGPPGSGEAATGRV